MKQGRKIVIGERTIVTPAARDLGEQHRIFVQAALASAERFEQVAMLLSPLGLRLTPVARQC